MDNNSISDTLQKFRPHPTILSHSSAVRAQSLTQIQDYSPPASYSTLHSPPVFSSANRNHSSIKYYLPWSSQNHEKIALTRDSSRQSMRTCFD